MQKLAHMIGNSVKLYDMVLQFLRTLFLRTRNVHYCTLRAELLMALHDLEVQVSFLLAQHGDERESNFRIYFYLLILMSKNKSSILLDFKFVHYLNSN